MTIKQKIEFRLENCHLLSEIQELNAMQLLQSFKKNFSQKIKKEKDYDDFIFLFQTLSFKS